MLSSTVMASKEGGESSKCRMQERHHSLSRSHYCGATQIGIALWPQYVHLWVGGGGHKYPHNSYSSTACTVCTMACIGAPVELSSTPERTWAAPWLLCSWAELFCFGRVFKPCRHGPDLPLNAKYREKKTSLFARVALIGISKLDV